MENGDVMRGKGEMSVSWTIAPLALVMTNMDGQMADNIETSNNSGELHQFTKWERIAPELKNHAMTYFDGKTLFEYAQASKLCNSEIQKFDTNVTSAIDLISVNDECSVLSIHVRFHNQQSWRLYGYTMKFINVENNKHKWIVLNRPAYQSTRVYQNDENAIYDGTALEGALRHLEDRSRIATRQKPFSLTLKFSAWPDLLRSFLRRLYEARLNVGHFWVHLNEQTYESFMELMEDSPISSNIHIECEPPERPFALPPAFFDSKLFRTIDSFDCSWQAGITDEQFLQSKASMLQFCDVAITAGAIYQKFLNWFNDMTIVSFTYYKFTCNSRNGEPDRRTIIGSLPFRQKNDHCYIIHKKNGVKGELCFDSNFLEFRGFDDD